MRSLLHTFLIISGLAFFLVACDKAEDLPVYANGKASVLSASVSTIAPIPADSLKPALTLSWTYPDYATDSANIKYRIEIDASGNNFTNPYVKEVTKDLSTTFLAKELNNILLAKGYAFNVPVDMDIRLISSYVNNNERIIANTIKVKVTPYKVPPKIALPASGKLFVTGGDFGWSNTDPMPAYQQITHVDETTWGGVFNFTGGQSYLLLGQAGSWDEKYGAINGNNSNNENGDDFKPAGGDIKSPAAGGGYKVIVDFQTGKFTVTKLDYAAPTALYITGDGTADGWTNTPSASQQFTPVTNGVFELTTTFAPGKYYKFLSISGQWQPQFGGTSDTGGDLAANGPAGDPASIPTPAVAGSYKITVNFITNKYTVVKL